MSGLTVSGTTGLIEASDTGIDVAGGGNLGGLLQTFALLISFSKSPILELCGEILGTEMEMGGRIRLTDEADA